MTADTQFKITSHMKAMAQDKFTELKTYYCREDYEQAILAVEKSTIDSRKFRMKDLERLCDARGISANTMIADRTILEQIPTREQMLDQLLQSFYDLYRNAPDTARFMERNVRRLAPEYAQDTVRTAILKKFVLGSGTNFRRFHIAGIFNWAKERFDEEERELFDNSDEQGQKELVVSKLNDSIFDQEPTVLTNTDLLILIADRIEKYRTDPSIDMDGILLSGSTRRNLAGFLNHYGISAESLSDTGLVHAAAQAVKTGAVPGQSLDGESRLVSALEEDFRKQLKSITKKGRKGTAADLYKQAKKDALKAKKKAAAADHVDLELLKLCDDLAKGNFRANGKTKVHLYYFAFMFEMNIPVNGKDRDPERDVEQNLFQDFYSDNPLRFLSGDYADPELTGSLENEPTGEGINYKNFVEAIYLYFLCRDDLGFTPGERIDKAEETIRKCVKLSKKRNAAGSIQTGIYTRNYRENYFQGLLNKNIEEIPDYILAHYSAAAPENAGSARIMIASEENTASGKMKELMEELDSIYDNPGNFDITRRKDMTSERKDDIAFKTNFEFDWKIKNLLEEKYSHDKNFLKVVSKLDSRVRMDHGRFHKSERERILTLLHVLYVHSDQNFPLSAYQIKTRMEEKGVVCVNSQFQEALAALRAIGVDIHSVRDDKCRDDIYKYYLGKRNYPDKDLEILLKYVSDRYYRASKESDSRLTALLLKKVGVNRRITRNNLIALYLSFYISTLDEEEETDTFPDVFENFAGSMNEHLTEARYQPLSEKNLFDLYVVTALYFYLVENNGYMYSSVSYTEREK